jgi:O-antigen/teichoic acid export membrane protein
MLTQIAFYSILGKPLIMYLGIITFLSFLFTATIGYLNMKGNQKIPLKWHMIMARVSILLAILHGILGLSIYL